MSNREFHKVDPQTPFPDCRKVSTACERASIPTTAIADLFALSTA